MRKLVYQHNPLQLSCITGNTDSGAGRLDGVHSRFRHSQGCALVCVKMGPRDSRDLAETNGNVHPAGNGKRRAKISRTSSNASFGDLPSEAMDAGIAAVRQISKILHFVHGYHEGISDVESIYDLGIRQQAHIDELNTTVNDLMFRKDQEMTRLQDENNAYQASVRQFELKREKLKLDHASMDDTRKAM